MSTEGAPRITPAMLVPPRRPAPAAAAPSTSLAFGRMDEDGTVYLLGPDGEQAVGQWVAGTREQGLAFFARRYDDLAAEVALTLARLREARMPAQDAQTTLTKARTALAAPDFIGDVPALAAACEELEALIGARREAEAAERIARREAALAARTALVTEAEALADSTDWKAAGDRIRTILEEWKAAPRADKGTEQALWKRLSAARTTFERRRRAHFATLDARRKEVVAQKEALIAEAQRLAQSTDWAATSRAFRGLVDRWKAAGRTSRAEDDRLWERFKAAQDSFFAARAAADAAADAVLAPNVAVKEGLAAEAEALLPIKDLRAAKETLRSIAARWDAAGDVPRADRERLERRLKAVEDAVRALEADRWRRDNPEARARAAATVEQFSAAVARHEAALSAARAAGDERRARDAESALASARPLLEAAARSLAEFGG